MGSLLARLLAGAAAGFLSWAVMEPLAPKRYGDEAGWGSWEGWFILLFSALVGLTVGGYDGFTRGGKVHFARGLGLGLLLGATGGMLGYTIGGSILEHTWGSGVFKPGHPLPEQIIARMVVFAPLGLCLGAAIGGSSLTLKRTVQGAIGGLIGAAIGGGVFDIVGAVLGPLILQVQGKTLGEVGPPSRAIAFTLIGASIALFIGLVERFSRSAWLRLNLGRNEGKEWSIDAPQTFIGRSEGVSVPLFGDANIAPVHASIQKQGNQYVIVDGGAPAGTFVNGHRIQQAVLTHGDAIQIASFVLQFLVKGIPAPARGPEGWPGQAYPIAGQQAAHAGVAVANPYGHAAPQQAYAPAPQPAAAYQAGPQQTVAYPQAPVSNQTVAYGVQQAPSASMFSLVGLDGQVAGQRFQVGGPVEVGREGSGIRLAADSSASRRHASVSPGFSGVQVNDLGSTNGTYVNGQRVQSAEARPGDVIKIGGTSFRVEAG